MFKHAQRICVFAISVTGLFAQSAPEQETRTTGVVGIAYAQTARFNVLNTSTNPGVSPPAVGVVCSAVLSYYDGKGALLKLATVTVLPGEIASLDLFSDVDLALPAAQRK